MKKIIYLSLFTFLTFELMGQSGWSPTKEVYISKTPARSAPANLEISDVTFSDEYGNSNSILDANEEAEISFTLSNRGKGNARSLAADVVPLMKGIELLFKKELGDLFSGQSMRIALPIRGIPFLQTGKAELEITVEEGNGFDSNPIRVVFNTERAKIPEIFIADYKFTSSDGETLELGHPISLTVMLQNKGQGEARSEGLIRENPSHPWPIEERCVASHLSVPHFSVRSNRLTTPSTGPPLKSAEMHGIELTRFLTGL